MTSTSHNAYFPFCVSTLICVVPVAFPVTVPSSETVAMFELLLFQLNKLYTFDVSGLIVAISFVVELFSSRVIDVLSNVTLFGVVYTVTLQLAVLLSDVFTVIIVSPFFKPVTVPSSETVATSFLLLSHVNFPEEFVVAINFSLILSDKSISSVFLFNDMFVSSCSSFFIFTVTSHIAYFPFCVSTFTCVAPVAFPVTVPSSETIAISGLLLVQLSLVYTFDVSGLIVAISF